MFRSAVLFAAVLAAFAAAAVETVLVCEDERMLPFLKSAAELWPEGIDFAPLAERPLVPAGTAGRILLEETGEEGLIAVVAAGFHLNDSSFRPARVAVFDRQSSCRLVDRSLPAAPGEAEQVLLQALRDAALNAGSPEKRKFAAVAETFFTELPLNRRAAAAHIAAALELRLRYLPGVITAGKSEMNDLAEETRLTGIGGRLPHDQTLLQLEFLPDGESFRIRLRAFDGNGAERYGREYPAAGTPVEAMLNDLAAHLGVTPGPAPSAAAEYPRLLAECEYLWKAGRFRENTRKAAAAGMLAAGKAQSPVFALRAALNSRGVLNAEPEEQFASLREAAALLEELPPASSETEAARLFRGLLRRLYESRECPAALRGEVAAWLSGCRPLILCGFRPDLPPPRVSAPLESLSPSLYFDDDAFLKEAVPALEAMAADAPRNEDEAFYRAVLSFGAEFMPVVELLPPGAEPQRKILRELARKLTASPGSAWKAFGLTLDYRLRLPLSGSEAEQLRNAYADALLKLPPHCRDAEAHSAIWSLLDSREEQKAVAGTVAFRRSRTLPADDPESAANASPAALFGLLKKQQVDALEMHRGKWAKVLHREFSSLDIDKLASFNPGYRFTRYGWAWEKGSIRGWAFDGRNGFILGVPARGRRLTLSMWDSGARRVKQLYEFPHDLLQLDNLPSRNIPMNAIDNCVLIGTGSQIVIARTSPGKPQIIENLPGRVMSMTLNRGRVYAFIADGDNFSPKFIRLISCRLDGKDMKTHIATDRPAAEKQNLFDRAASTFTVSGLGRKIGSGKLYFHTVANGRGPSGFWEFDTETGEANRLFCNAADGRTLVMSSHGQAFFTQQRDLLCLGIYGYRSVGDGPAAFFLRYDVRTGKKELYGWGDEAILKKLGLASPWGKRLNFSGPFWIEGDNFWGAGGWAANKMAVHFRLSAPEQSPRLLFPCARGVFPGNVKNSVVFLTDDSLVEVRCLSPGTGRSFTASGAERL